VPFLVFHAVEERYAQCFMTTVYAAAYAIERLRQAHLGLLAPPPAARPAPAGGAAGGLGYGSNKSDSARSKRTVRKRG
jgi:hypothetical protein